MTSYASRWDPAVTKGIWLRSVGFAPDALHGDSLGGEHLVLQGVHRRRGLVDRPRESERCRENRREPRLILNASLRVFVLHDQEGLLRIDAQQLACGELMVQPVHRTVLKVRERIVPRGARQLVLAEHGLLLPRMALLAGCGAGLRPAPVATLHRLTPVAPGRDPARIDHLALDVKAGDQKVVAGVLQILEYRARVLPHEDGVRGVIVDAELVADAVP